MSLYMELFKCLEFQRNHAFPNVKFDKIKKNEKLRTVYRCNLKREMTIAIVTLILNMWIGGCVEYDIVIINVPAPEPNIHSHATQTTPWPSLTTAYALVHAAIWLIFQFQYTIHVHFHLIADSKAIKTVKHHLQEFIYRSSNYYPSPKDMYLSWNYRLTRRSTTNLTRLSWLKYSLVSHLTTGYRSLHAHMYRDRSRTSRSLACGESVRGTHSLAITRVVVQTLNCSSYAWDLKGSGRWCMKRTPPQTRLPQSTSLLCV